MPGSVSGCGAGSTMGKGIAAPTKGGSGHGPLSRHGVLLTFALSVRSTGGSLQRPNRLAGPSCVGTDTDRDGDQELWPGRRCWSDTEASDEAPIMVPCEHHHIRMHQSHWPMWPRAGSLMVNDERGPAGAAATGRQGQGRGPEREVPPYHLTRGPWSEIGDDDADFRRTLLLLFAFLHLPLPRLVPAILPSCQVWPGRITRTSRSE